MDFENTVDRGSAVIFDADSGLCLSYARTLGPKQNLDHNLDRCVNEFIQIISFFERSSSYFRCETVIGIVLCCCHQARCLLYYLGEIDSGIHMYQFTSVQTFTLLFSDAVVVSDLNKNFGGSTDLAKKRHGSADLHTPIHPPQRKRRYLQARRVHGFPNSLVLFNLTCIEVDVLTLYPSFEIR